MVLGSLSLFLFGLTDVIILRQLLEKRENLILLNFSIFVSVQLIKCFVKNLLGPFDFLTQFVEGFDQHLFGLVAVK